MGPRNDERRAGAWARRLVLAGLVVAVVLLLAAQVVQRGVRREFAALARAAAETAERERAQHDTLSGRHAATVASAQRLTDELALARERATAEHRELMDTRRAAHRVTIRAADLALRAGNLAEARALLGEEPGEHTGLEWHLVDARARASSSLLHRGDATIVATALSADGSTWAAADFAGALHVGRTTVLHVGQTARDALNVSIEPPDELVRGLAFDASGRSLAVASVDWSARVFALDDGRELAHFAGHFGPVNAAVFVGGSTRVATAGEDGTLRLWDTAREHEEVWLVDAHASPILGLAADPGGERLATVSVDAEVKLWRASDGASLATLAGHDDWVHGVAFSADGARFASASDDGTARVFDATSGELVAVLEGHRAPVVAVWLDARGDVAVTAGEDGTVRRWDVDRGAELARLAPGGLALAHMNVAADGSTVLLSRGDEDVLLASLAPPPTWRALGSVDGAGAGAVAIGTNGDIAVGRTDGVVELRDAQTGRVTASTTAAGGVLSLAIHNTRVAAGRRDGTVSVFFGADLATHLELAAHEAGVVAVAWSPDGARVASASYAGAIAVHDAATGELVLEKPGPRQLVFAVSLDAGGAHGAWVAAGGLMRAWELEGGERSAALRDPELGRVTAGAIAGSGGTLVTVTTELVMTSFDLATETRLARSEPFPGHMTVLALSPDGTRAATARIEGGPDGGLDLWDTQRAEHLLHVAGPDERLVLLAFSPDGRMLVGATTEGALVAFGGAELEADAPLEPAPR